MDDKKKDWSWSFPVELELAADGLVSLFVVLGKCFGLIGAD